MKTLSLLGQKAAYDSLWVLSALSLLLPKHPFPEAVRGSGLTDGVEGEGVWLRWWGAPGRGLVNMLKYRNHEKESQMDRP